MVRIIEHLNSQVRVKRKKRSTYVLDRKEMGVTDLKLGLLIGNEFDEVGRMYRLKKLDIPPPGQNGSAPSIDRNPYNSVPLGGTAPWLEKGDEKVGFATHEKEKPGAKSGWMEISIELKTPLFVPEGFPAQKLIAQADNKDSQQQRDKYQAELREITRHFSRIQDDKGQIRYAIPGSSLKGALRSKVEQISNSRFTVFDEKKHSAPHLYRRRALRCVGRITETKESTWTVEAVRLLYVKAADWPQGIAGKPYQIVAKCNHEGHIVSKLLAIPQAAPIPPRLAGVARGTFLKTIPYCGSLLCQPDNKGYSHWIVESVDQPETYDLPQEVRDEYQKKVIPSQHIKDHYAARYKNEYRHPPDLPLEEVCRQLELQKDDVVFFTHEHHEHHEHPVITTIGKSVNYLWPAKKSVFDLVKPYVTPENLGLSDSLSLAERLFGFSGKHRLAREEQNESHPFRGLVTVETAWGAVAQSYEEEAKWQELRPGEPIDENAVGFRVRLAPLTSPATHAKSRPLYLEPRTESRAMNGRSASYDDKEARFRGRKEYWHQNTADPARPIWEYHLFDAKWHEPVKTQCPPPLAVLNAVPSNTFHGRIQFKNLTDLELGALVQALEGDNENYCLKIGKGRPRGLGSIRVKIERVSLVNYEERYQTFGARAGIKEVSPEDLARWKQTFGKWQKEKDGEEAIAQATKNLGTFPGQASVRYYPLNFGQYSWLPNDQPGNTAGEPRPQDGRPPAMKKAADLKP